MSTLQRGKSNAAELADGTQKLPLAASAPPAPPAPRDIHVGPSIFTVLSLVALVFTTTSIGLPWFRVRQYKPESTGGASTEGRYYLFKSVWKEEGRADITLRPEAYCAPVSWRTRVVEAFAIMSAVAALATAVFSVLHMKKGSPKSPLRTVMLALAAGTFVSLTIQLSFVLNIYLWSYEECGVGSSYHSMLYEPDVAFGLTGTAWVLMAVGGVVAANDPVLPLDARTIDMGIHTYALLSLIACLFSTVACAIPHWYYKNKETRRVTDVSLWKHQKDRFQWALSESAAHYADWNYHLGCRSLTRWYYAAETFSVLSAVFHAGAGLMGLLRWKQLAGTQLPTLLLSYIGCVTSLVLIVVEMIIFYRSWCDGKYAYRKHYYILSAGFGLATTALVLIWAATAVHTVVVWMTSRYFPEKRPQEAAKDVFVKICR